jgi:hypothetical protein
LLDDDCVPIPSVVVHGVDTCLFGVGLGLPLAVAVADDDEYDNGSDEGPHDGSGKCSSGNPSAIVVIAAGVEGGVPAGVIFRAVSVVVAAIVVTVVVVATHPKKN